MERSDEPRNDEPKGGISLRVVRVCLVVVTVLMSGAVIYSTMRLASSFTRVTNATEEHHDLEEAALELMEASDYLTECVQRFTVDGNRRFMDEYFTEAFEANRREKALAKMENDPQSGKALEQLRSAMANSVQLMNQEYYAMRLVIEAKGYTDYPEPLRDVVLTDEDQRLSAEDKMRRATEMVLNDSYYEQKERIRSDMQRSLNEVENLTRAVDSAELERLQREIVSVRVIAVLMVLAILFLAWLTVRLGINPVLLAVDQIKADNPIPEQGANEFRYLAHEYNKMYAAYQHSIERLNFKACHDELTGVYNRSGYQLLLSSIDLNTTYMLLFDMDDFKDVNDTYGHETGDKALVKLAEVLKANFRADDLVCRIGGDEFVVLMVHAGDLQRGLVDAKIERINEQLKNADDEVPPLAVSVGVALGSDAKDVKSLFDHADAAMYEAKKNGKGTHAFYAPS